MKKHVNIPTFFIIPLLIKMIILQATLADAFGLFSLCCLSGFYFFLEFNKEDPINEKIKQDISALREQFSTLKSSVDSYKIAVGMRKS